MKRSTRLEKISDINASFEIEAGSLLASAQAQHHTVSSQLEKLVSYRKDYHQQLKSKMEYLSSASTIQGYHQFVSTLETAILQQTEVVKNSARHLEASRINWIKKKQDVKKLTRAAEILRLQENDKARKLEQIESDELSIGRFNKKKRITI
ncbi:MAG: flagellar export protein FliJ [SAR86 cluster bacterium]|uniref:Flagellar FliJ protein n=1 Tax=SAR86 cluster bacterium TaxID=2030880 RepID=A0A2A5B506_9GAMM|nr:MAG: flagellar export protein FliJ [SAR86 cluster bacterium]